MEGTKNKKIVKSITIFILIFAGLYFIYRGYIYWKYTVNGDETKVDSWYKNKDRFKNNNPKLNSKKKKDTFEIKKDN
ncbi:hypothetical protein [Chryseobacterium oryctis]|uniref:Uncharacterized protein n=1 Tax=Chryseobacterium oryctis TaxID=2952618 RepID=A0ABT3HIZ2_9FLAO|nr:hypothetical protein [Chryseobacterium oryctis]MCW3159683.1 hypothetical protein [Chryseobacterium oryctis]